jgi:hypothetical protein
MALVTWIVGLCRTAKQACCWTRRARLSPALRLQRASLYLRFCGLAFARWEDGRVFFGLENLPKELTVSIAISAEVLGQKKLESYRRPLAGDTKHRLYRTQAERWLENIIAEDVTRIDAALNPRLIYAQVFANVAGEHIHLPLQGADYWLRVRRHLEQGDFARYGYFPRDRVTAHASAYLVAPALRFHPATDTLLRFFSPEMEVIRVGVTEGWRRRGLRVVMCQQCRARCRTGTAPRQGSYSKVLCRECDTFQKILTKKSASKEEKQLRFWP